MTRASTRGIHHVGLTVPDLESARSFFCDGLGWTEVGARPDYPAVFVSDGTITLTLWKVQAPDRAVAFDRKANVGLHHLALAVPDAEALEALHLKVRDIPGVRIEFEPGPMRAGSNVRHFICFMPGGPRIEFATQA